MIAFPNIYIPTWRETLAVLFGDELKRDSNGVLYKNADGVLVNECAATPCSSCTGYTPLTVDVTFAGVEAAACTGCGPTGGDWASSGGYFKVTGLTIDGTHTLSQISACVWELDNVGSYSVDIYSDSGCTTFVETKTGQFTVHAEHFNFGVHVWQVWAREKPYSLATAAAFWGISNLNTGDCDVDSSTENNDLGCHWTGTGRNNLSNGGTSVVSPN